MKKFFSAVLLSTLFTFTARAENLLTNSSFDTPDADFNTDDSIAQWAGTSWNRWGNNFRQRWAARSGHAGGYFRGWMDGTNGSGVYQDVPSTGGTYTFSVWMRREPAFSLNLMDVKIEWYDAGLTNLQTTFGTFNTLPADGLWHQVYVTSTATNTGNAYVRPVLYANWNSAGGSLTFDDAQVYSGTYTGSTPRLVNRSFEFYTTNTLRGTQWASPQDPPPVEDMWTIPWWAARSGGLGLALAGWLTNTTSYFTEIAQNITPGTGTYTFAVWMRREAGFLMTNAGLRIEWYDNTFTNQVQAGVTTSFIVPGDETNWYEYYVTGTCTADAVREARAVIYAGWDRNLGGGNKALRIDDARFFAGAYVPSPGPEEIARLDYLYFNGNSNAAMPQAESVPGLGGATFFNYSYATDGQSYIYTLVSPGSIMGMRARMFFQDGGGEIWRDGAWYTNVVIDSGAKFHNYPSSGAATMEVWRAGFYPPGNWQGNMWYSPAVRLAADGVEWWMAGNADGGVTSMPPGTLIGSIDTATNNWPTDPQKMWNVIPYNHDWLFAPTAAIPRFVTTDWAYYNHTNLNPQTEIIPAMDGTSTFMRISYASTSTIWYLLAEKPLKELLPGENSYILMRTSWYNTESNLWSTDWRPMTWVSNLVLDASSAPFHGLPTVGKHTVDLWRFSFPQPLSTNGAPQTNAITVYYAPLLKVVFGPSEYVVDERYLLRQIEGATNGWGWNNYTTNAQYYGGDPVGNHDWFYFNQWALADTNFTDGIPNSWLSQYGLGLTNGVAAGDDDGDGYNNLEEYAGNTVPTNNGSYFSNVTNVPGSKSVMILIVNPSSAARVYDAWWKTNLMDPTAWQSYGLSVPGNGGLITLTVTNDHGKSCFRAGARMP